jgi:hypothetical protein
MAAPAVELEGFWEGSEESGAESEGGAVRKETLHLPRIDILFKLQKRKTDG